MQLETQDGVVLFELVRAMISDCFVKALMKKHNALFVLVRCAVVIASENHKHN